MGVLASEQAAEQTAVETLYRRYRRDVYALAYHAVGSRADAEDVAQTTFLNAHQALLRGAEPADERAWLLAIARNACKTRFRTQVRRPQEEPLDEAVLAASAASDERPSSIVDALRRLHPRQREALVLQAVDGRSTAEIGQRLGLARSAVDALLHRARAALRDELQASVDPLECAHTETLVERQLTEALPEREQATLRAHLRTCASCATRARRIRARRRLASLLALPWELLPRLGSLLGHAGAGVKAATVVGAIVIGATAVTETGSPPPSRAGQPVRPTAARVSAGADASVTVASSRVAAISPRGTRARPAAAQAATQKASLPSYDPALPDAAPPEESTPIAPSPASSSSSQPSPRAAAPPPVTSPSTQPLTLPVADPVGSPLETVDTAVEDLGLPVSLPAVPEPSLDQAPAVPDPTPAAPPLPQLP